MGRGKTQDNNEKTKRSAGKKKAVKPPARTSVTCMHCRYEYDARAARCPICGYPWPWLD